MEEGIDQLMESIFGINHGDKVGGRDGDEVGSRDGDEVGSSDDDETSSSDGDVSVDDASGDEIHDEGPSGWEMDYKV